MGPQTDPDGRFVLPAGTVTFLLTDIEGSSRLWEAAPEQMAPAVARHYAILDEAISRYGGVRPLEQGEGDSVVAAFTRASDALSAAIDAQRHIAAEPWPPSTPIRVRMALHTGEAQLRDQSNYFGKAVIRCARLRSAGHGGQILVSRTAHDLALDSLPEAVGLVDLGRHRLRDLGRPEHVYVVSAPGLPEVALPLKSLEALPTNLPSELTSFVGRREELQELGLLMRQTRLLTLTGAGGAGKTRLAMHAAAEALDEFPGGAWWVELAAVEDPEKLVPAVIAALGLREASGVAPVETLVERFETDVRTLLVLDNCEHLLAEAARLVQTLLSRCPGLSLITTSRAPLGVPGETTWRVPSLSLPGRDERPAIEALSQFDAVRLFIDRALAVRPNFKVTEANAPAIAQICFGLDGIPLAIELAAARTRMLAVEQIAAALDDRFRLLTGGARTAMPRQQTLEASIAWSHDLLGERERTLFRRLSVFTGDWTLDAAEAICPDEQLDRYSVLDLLSSLVDRSLVAADEREPGVGRFRLLETIRQYAAARLLAAGEEERVRERHVEHYRGFVESAEAGLLGPEPKRWLDVIERDAPNIRAAVEWALRRRPEAAAEMGTVLQWWWWRRGYSSDGIVTLERVLEALADQPTRLRGLVLNALGVLRIWAGEYEPALTAAAEAIKVGETIADDVVLGRALSLQGLALSVAVPKLAVAPLERAIDLLRGAGDLPVAAHTISTLAFSYSYREMHDQAAAVSHEGAELARAIRYPWYESYHQMILGHSDVQHGRLSEARRRFEQVERSARELDDPLSFGIATMFVGWVDTMEGRWDHATARAAEGRELLRRAGRNTLVDSLVQHLLIRCDLALGQPRAARERAERLLATEVMYVERGWQIWSIAAALNIEGRAREAQERAEELMAHGRDGGNAYLEARGHHAAGRALTALGEFVLAENHLHEALKRDLELGNAWAVADSLEALGELAASLESDVEATRLLAAASAQRDRIACVRWPPETEHWTALIDGLKDRLGRESFDDAWSDGQELGLEEAVTYARRGRGARKRPPRGWASLTPAELQIVELVAQGFTNPQIGERLFITRGTVKVHLSHIFGKLGMSTRAEVAAAATRHRMDALVE